MYGLADERGAARGAYLLLVGDFPAENAVTRCGPTPVNTPHSGRKLAVGNNSLKTTLQSATTFIRPAVLLLPVFTMPSESITLL